MKELFGSPWRLRIRRVSDGAVCGAGFLILPDVALTCAHVVSGDDSPADVLVDMAESGGTGIPAVARPVPGWRHDMSRDLAVLTFPGDLPDAVPAVLDGDHAPASGTALAAFGFPRGFGPRRRPRQTINGPEPGVWTPVSAEGTGLDGKLLQYTSRQPQSVPVQEGFSGGPVVEELTGLVVAMTTHAKEGQALAYGLLAHTIRARLPRAVVERMRAGRRPPPSLERVVAALNRRGGRGSPYPDYPAARNALAPLLGLDAEQPDVAYYAALTALGGRRPRDPAVLDVLPRIDRRLRATYDAGTSTPHLLALWAVVKEDGFIGRGMGDSSPPAGELRRSAVRTDPAHAAEICDLVPAPESPTWQLLNDRRSW
jgi:hypothetical protein